MTQRQRSLGSGSGPGEDRRGRSRTGRDDGPAGRRRARPRLGRHAPDRSTYVLLGPVCRGPGRATRGGRALMTASTRTAPGHGVPGRHRCPGEPARRRRRRELRVRRRLVPAHPRPGRRGARADRRARPPRRAHRAVHLRPRRLDAGRPRKIVVGGRTVRTGGFRSMDPRRRLPDLGRRHAARRPARRPAGDRRPHRCPRAAAVHPARPAAVAADGARRGPLEPHLPQVPGTYRPRRC